MHLSRPVLNQVAICLLFVLFLSTLDSARALPGGKDARGLLPGHKGKSPGHSGSDNKHDSHGLGGLLPGKKGNDHGSSQGSGGNGSPQSSSSGKPDNKHLDDINPVDDGPTADKKPGLGIEFESAGVVFSQSKCDEAGTFALKGELIQGHDHQTYTSKKKHGDSTTTPKDSSKGGKKHTKRGSSRPGSKHGSPQGSRSSSPQRGPSTSPKGKDSTSQHHSQEMDDWKLTGDTTQGRPGSLTGEYILNGKTIKLGTKRAGAAAKEVHEDFVSQENSTTHTTPMLIYGLICRQNGTSKRGTR